jgi:hypothetical protein
MAAQMEKVAGTPVAGVPGGVVSFTHHACRGRHKRERILDGDEITEAEKEGC